MNYQITKETKTYPHKKHWQFCVGSCHAAMAMRSDYAKQLSFIHDELGIQYVRFHGIFNDDMHTMDSFRNVIEAFPGGEHIIERNFYLCGVAYDNVLDCGMKPFVELSFMPKALARDPYEQKGFYGTNFSHPKDLSEWADYIQAFIKFLLHRYGEEEVHSWYFEVWNEPDLTGAFYLGSQEEYFALYETTARAIKAIDPALRVGGPSTSGSKWIPQFMAFCQEHEVPLDFVSTHQYAGDPFTGIEEGDVEETKQGASSDKKAKLAKAMEKITALVKEDTTCLSLTRSMFGDPTETKDLANDTFYRNSSIVKSKVKDLPLFYTEWNLQATFSAYSNDTRKMAAYDIKTALDIEHIVDGSSIWCFSDLFEEMHQFKEEFHGGFGMQSIHGIPKPVFYGMKLLAQCGNERFDLGAQATNQEIGIAAFQSDHEKQVLLFRQKMKQLPLPKETVSVQIEVSQLPRRVTLQRIDETHGNPLRIWEEQGSRADLNKTEVMNIIEKSKMVEEVIPYEYHEGIVTLSFDLAVNDVYFVKIEEA